MSNERKNIQDLLNFIDRSPTPFHAVNEMKNLLIQKGFSELKETNSWKLSPNGKYFVFASNRNQAKRGDTNIFIAEWQN